MAAEERTENPFRLLPLPVLGALTGDPDAALPVCVLSALWWAGAEALDDLMDGEFDARGVGMTASQTMVAATVCLTLLPQTLIGRIGLGAERERFWTRELTASGMRCAGGQLDDVDSSGVLSWRRVMVGYAGKTGAPYARDAVLSATLAGAGAGSEELRGWRVFGELFGVLRQLANDRAASTAREDADLANGTWTLLLAYAAETLTPAELAALLDAHARAPDEPAARDAVWNRLRRPDLMAGYNRRITGIHRRLSALLHQLARPSHHREQLRRLVDASATTALLTVGDGVA
ncbi:polyprenyl synthase [Streptomyces canus]|uniref:polyprenyl synthase n=1 Tax=Streptomyces canus TaxID=58343 RepID=UPI0037F33D28